MVEFNNSVDVKDWERSFSIQKNDEIKNILAARAILRVGVVINMYFIKELPQLNSEIVAKNTILPYFRVLLYRSASCINKDLFYKIKDIKKYIFIYNKNTIEYADDSAKYAYIAAFMESVTENIIYSESSFLDYNKIDESKTKEYNGIYSEAAIDATDAENGVLPEIISQKPLWSKGEPEWSKVAMKNLESTFARLGDDWDVWSRWLQDRIDGAPVDLELETRRALIADEDWDKGPAHVNKLIKEIEAERARELAAQAAPTTEEIVAVASPAAGISRDGKVDATPNPEIDKPLVDDDLPTLPLRQMSVIATILDGLGANAPATLKSALAGYSSELRVRGVQPIIGILADMCAIIDGDRAAPDADQWLVHGLKAAFGRLDANHAVLMQHFPLNEVREKVLARLKPDESHAPDDKVGQLAGEFVVAAQEAFGANIATETFAKVAQAQAQSLDIVISMPPPAPEKTVDIKVDPADRIVLPAPKKVPYRVRIVASLAGFALGVVGLAKHELLGRTANLIQVFESAAFDRLVKAALALFDALRRYLGI